MSKVVLKIMESIINQLADEGQRIIDKAANDNETERRTGNMEDAYGCAVYYKKKRVRTRYYHTSPRAQVKHKGWPKHAIPENTGRGYLNTFFDEWTPESDNLTLVCVNAVYYTPILEDGIPSVDHTVVRFKIISGVRDDLDKLAKKYGGHTYSLRK